MWIPILIVGLTMATMTLSFHRGCPELDKHICTFLDSTANVDILRPEEIPPAKQVVDDLKTASREIQEVVKEEDLKGFRISHSASDKDNIFSPFIHSCCGRPVYNCTKKEISIWFIRWFHSICFVVYSFPKQPHYARCTCRTCILQGYCPIIGRCVETDYKYYHLIVYCPRYYRKYVKILIRAPNNCECLSGCPSFIRPLPFAATPDETVPQPQPLTPALRKQCELLRKQKGPQVQRTELQEGAQPQTTETQEKQLQGTDAQGTPLQETKTQGAQLQGMETQGTQRIGTEGQETQPKEQEKQGTQIEGRKTQQTELQDAEVQSNQMQTSRISEPPTPQPVKTTIKLSKRKLRRGKKSKGGGKTPADEH